MIISFAWTASQLLSGQKTVTRRTWTDVYASTVTPGMICQAWDKSPWFGGRHIADIRITDLYKEALRDMPESDLTAEGFPELSRDAFMTKFFGEREIDLDTRVWVVRFELDRIKEAS
jgi:hypothetical protein